MKLNEILDVFLITYNRKNDLDRTLKQILSINSPIKNITITILDNNSNDGTDILVKKYQQKYKNLRHIINNKNIGGNANAAKAFELASKKYIWVLCDDDQFDFSQWYEVEEAMNNNVDAVIVTKHKNPDKDKIHMILSMSFLPGVIYKNKMITDTIMVNAYYLVASYFPQLAIAFSLINKNAKIFLIKGNIVSPRPVPIDTKYTYTRGLDTDKANNMSNIFWSIGVLNALDILNDKKLREDIIEFYNYNGKYLLKPRQVVSLNKELGNEALKNLCDAFSMYSTKNKVKLIYYYFLNKFVFLQYYKCLKNFFSFSFSIKNSKDKKHKVITILGIKFKFKRKKEGKK